MEQIKKIDHYNDCDDLMFPDAPLTKELGDHTEVRFYNHFVFGVIKYDARKSKCSSGVKYK